MPHAFQSHEWTTIWFTFAVAHPVADASCSAGRSVLGMRRAWKISSNKSWAHHCKLRSRGRVLADTDVPAFLQMRPLHWAKTLEIGFPYCCLHSGSYAQLDQAMSGCFLFSVSQHCFLWCRPFCCTMNMTSEAPTVSFCWKHIYFKAALSGIENDASVVPTLAPHETQHPCPTTCNGWSQRGTALIFFSHTSYNIATATAVTNDYERALLANDNA